MLERRTYYADPDRVDSDPYGPSTPIEEPGEHGANLISSVLADGYHSDGDGLMHAPVIDVDFPIAVVPSSTPGHFHLYIDKPMFWDQYVELLAALENAGIVQHGFVHHSVNRKKSVLRMPWVNKKRASAAAPLVDPEPF